MVICTLIIILGVSALIVCGFEFFASILLILVGVFTGKSIANNLSVHEGKKVTLYNFLFQRKKDYLGEYLATDLYVITQIRVSLLTYAVVLFKANLYSTLHYIGYK